MWKTQTLSFFCDFFYHFSYREASLRLEKHTLPSISHIGSVYYSAVHYYRTLYSSSFLARVLCSVCCGSLVFTAAVSFTLNRSSRSLPKTYSEDVSNILLILKITTPMIMLKIPVAKIIISIIIMNGDWGDIFQMSTGAQWVLKGDITKWGHRLHLIVCRMAIIVTLALITIITMAHILTISVNIICQ